MNIRQANIDDIPQLVAMWREMADMHAVWQPMFELSEEPEEKHRKHLESSLMKDNFHLLIAEEGGRLAGYITLVLGTRPEVFVVRQTCSIHDTYVRPEYRKKGIGRKLVAAALDLAKEKGAGMLSLSVEVHNEVGNEFWQQVGFKPTLNFMTMYLS